MVTNDGLKYQERLSTMKRAELESLIEFRKFNKLPNTNVEQHQRFQGGEAAKPHKSPLLKIRQEIEYKMQGLDKAKNFNRWKAFAECLVIIDQFSDNSI